MTWRSWKLSRLRQVEHIDGAVEAGDGVGVRPEFQAQPLQRFDELAFRDMVRFVERHMFDEVGEAALLVAFADRAESEAQPDRRRALGRRVAHHRIFHAVG